jgi:hypothetical protein
MRHFGSTFEDKTFSIERHFWNEITNSRHECPRETAVRDSAADAVSQN